MYPQKLHCALWTQQPYRLYEQAALLLLMLLCNKMETKYHIFVEHKKIA